MTLSGRRPWLLSLGVHLALAGFLLTVYTLKTSPGPSLVTMHLVQTGIRGEPAVSVAGSGWWSGIRKNEAPNNPETSAPDWRPLPLTSAAETAVPAPARLEELLGSDPPAEAKPHSLSEPPLGWSSASGEGYAPPPLPPPTLAPPQGAAWNLTIFVPAGGGGASAVEGIDSGHPALDRWLDDYLRTVSFPPSPDGQPYQTHWILHLQSGKPQ